jgi:hypothetical protein
MDKEKRELAAAGPNARMMLTDTWLGCQQQGIHTNEKKRTWLKPFVAPRDARLGDAADMKIKMAPEPKRKKKTGYRLWREH